MRADFWAAWYSLILNSAKHVSKIGAPPLCRRTALHVAAVRGLEEAARLLLHAGADADFAAKGGQTPRAEAQAARRSAILRLFDEVTE